MKRLQSAPQKISYAYLITPEGLEEKSKIAAHLLKQKQEEYEQIKGRIKEITEELEIFQRITRPAEGLAPLNRLKM